MHVPHHANETRQSPKRTWNLPVTLPLWASTANILYLLWGTDSLTDPALCGSGTPSDLCVEVELECTPVGRRERKSDWTLHHAFDFSQLDLACTMLLISADWILHVPCCWYQPTGPCTYHAFDFSRLDLARIKLLISADWTLHVSCFWFQPTGRVFQVQRNSGTKRCCLLLGPLDLRQECKDTTCWSA